MWFYINPFIYQLLYQPSPLFPHCKLNLEFSSLCLPSSDCGAQGVLAVWPILECGQPTWSQLIKENQLFPSSYQMQMVTFISPCWIFCLAWACIDFVHAAPQLLWFICKTATCVWETLFPWCYPQPLILTIFHSIQQCRKYWGCLKLLFSVHWPSE